MGGWAEKIGKRGDGRSWVRRRVINIKWEDKIGRKEQTENMRMKMDERNKQNHPHEGNKTSVFCY